jgi:hypothetical protein
MRNDMSSYHSAHSQTFPIQGGELSELAQCLGKIGSGIVGGALLGRKLSFDPAAIGFGAAVGAVLGIFCAALDE